MPLNISSQAVIEKNKLNSTGMWLLLVKIEYEGETPGYLCLNNEQIVWNGNTWLPAVFDLKDITETKDPEIPAVPLTIVDVNGNVLPIIEKYGGGVGATITLYEVHSDALSNTVPEVEYQMEVIDVSVDHESKITFRLGAENLMKLRCSIDRFLKNHCRFEFKGTDGRCGYTGTAAECNRTLTRCKELGNQTRYGGFPGVGTVGVQV